MITNSLFRRILSLLIMAQLIAACGSSSKEADFNTLYPNIPMHNYLQLQLNPWSKSIQTESIIVKNISSKPIVYTSSSKQILTYDEKQRIWLVISNEMKDMNRQQFIVYPEADVDKRQFSDDMFSIYPDLTNQTKPITIRFVLIGEIIENDEPTGEKVGGFIDITLEP